MKKTYLAISIFFLILAGNISIRFLTKKEPPLISVIMGSYNRGGDKDSLLLKAVNSILAQTEKNFEFIIINDGSTDNTAELLKELEKKDPRIIVLTNKKNHGLFYSLNRGLDIAKGKYIARMDDDDLSVPERFQKQVEFLEKNPDITVVGCAATFFNQSNSHSVTYYYPSDPDVARLWAFTRVPILHACTMMRRDFLEKNHIRYTKKYVNSEDMDFWFKITLLHNGLLSSLPDVLYKRKTDSIKKANYRSIQIKSFNQYIKDSFKYFLGEDAQCDDPCVCLKKLQYNDKFKQLVDLQKIKLYIAATCPSGHAIYVKHDEWTDYLIFDKDNRVHRFYKRYAATILEKSNDKITLKWDDWDKETLIKDDKGIYHSIKQKNY